MPTTTRFLTRGALAAMASIAFAPALHAQAPRMLGPATADGEPRLMGGLSFTVGQPRGAFNRNVDEGYGVGAHALYRVDRAGAFALRLDGGFLNYGHETMRVPLNTGPGGGRVQLDLTTTNNIFWVGVGPQLMAPRGPVPHSRHGTQLFT
jgi:hypothetical protein